MSNAMRFGKRSLAGVAAGALALGMLTIASAPAVSAKSIKPKAQNSVSSLTSPVRVSFAGTTLEAVPFAAVSWTASGSMTTSATAQTVTLTTAPSPTAQIGIVGVGSIGVGGQLNSGDAIVTSGQWSNATDTAILGQPTNATVTVAAATGTSGAIGIVANQAGTYAGTILVGQVDGNTDLVSFSFTTTGKPTSMALSPASQTVPVNGATALTLTLKDAAGNTTQPLNVDTVSVTDVLGTVQSPTATGSGATSLYDGSATLAYTAPGTVGVDTVTATPAGTLPSSGVTTQTASVTISGEVSSTPVTAITVTEPTDRYITSTTVTNATAQVPAGTTAVTVRVTGAASTTYRFSASTSAGSVDGTGTSGQPVYKTVTTGANGLGTMAFTLGGNATLNNATLTVTQVTAAAGSITNAGKITVTQKNPAIQTDTIYATPYGSVVAAIGTTVKVNVTVTDQFGDPVSGSVVRAYRTSFSGALLSTATTNASGIASLTVNGATGITSGTTEAYKFSASTTDGTVVEAAGTYGNLSVQYTTSGAVTGMSVAVSGGAQTPILNSTTAITSMPEITVPSSGTVTGTTTSQRVYAVSTGASSGTATNWTTFTASAIPANTVTVTVPEGVKVTDYAPNLYSIAWNSALGGQTISVASGQEIYIYATKTGIHDITFTSGAITTTAKVRVTTPASASYNIALSPEKQTLQENAFGTLKLTVTDMFGNPVPSASSVTVSVTGEALLGGTTNAVNVVTGTDGTATLSVIAGRPGTAQFSAAPTSPATDAWAATYVKPAGFADPIKSAKSDLVVTKKESRTIVVTGSGRTTVSGKPGVYADGDTDGFVEGAKLSVWVRFPGQTTYTKGSGTPAVDKSGAFSWERKTGKKTYVYFTSADEAISSNTVIIPAK